MPSAEEIPPQSGSPEGRTPDLSLVLPCFNEAESLRHTIVDLVESFRRRGVDLDCVLVDNGSTDETGRIIDELRAEGLPVVKEKVDVNQGYGNGILRGLRACRGRFVGFVCADGQVEAADVVKVYEIAAHSKVPRLVKVRRRFRMDGLQRKAVSVGYNLLTTALFGGLGSIDINGNPKIFPRDVLDRMQLESKDWFLDAEVMIKAKRLGLEVYELNVMGRMREGGKSQVRPSTCWEFLVNLVKQRLGRPTGRLEPLPAPRSRRA